MSVGSDTQLREALAKFGGTNLGLYAVFGSVVFGVVLTFRSLIEPWISMPMLLFIQILPSLGLITIHLSLILRSIGKAGRLTTDGALSKSTRLFFGGAMLALMVPLAYFGLHYILPSGIYEVIIEYAFCIYAAIIPTYLLVYRKALALLWLWVSRYVEDHPGETGKLDIIALHPKGRLMVLTFKAIFGEGETRARAGTKLAYYATYQANPEEDDADITTKNLAITTAPKNFPFHS